MGIEQLAVFLLGTAVGSAANAVIDRLPRGESWIKGRSHCDKCGHTLGFFDLIPLLSYVWLGGKCRYCRVAIPYRNLVVELLMGAGFSSIYNLQFTIFNQFSIFNSLILQMIFWITVVIAVMDWETKLVSELLVFIWGILVTIFNYQFQIEHGLLGVLAAVGLIGGIWAVSRGKAMGFGDVEIAAVLGWWLGWPKIAPALWIAFVAGAVVGVIKIIKRLSKLRSEIAFGPFLILGGWVAFIWGEKLIDLIF